MDISKAYGFIARPQRKRLAPMSAAVRTSGEAGDDVSFFLTQGKSTALALRGFVCCATLHHKP